MVYAPIFSNVLYFNIYQHGCYILFLYILPLTVLMVLNTHLIIAIQYSRQRNREMMVNGGYRLTRAFNNCDYPQQMSTRQLNTHAETNATFVLIIIVLFFILCETPELIYRIITVLARHIASVEKMFSPSFQHKFTTITELLMVCNSSVNFFVYCAFGRRFRRVMKITFTPSGTNVTTL